MRTYVCDWCNRPKKAGVHWILGFAAERVTSSGVQREISIEAAWSERRADHPLAVHFCSEEHKDFYIAALFRNQKRASSVASAARKKRSRHVERSVTALGAVSVQTKFRTKQLPAIETVAAKRHKSSQAKIAALDSADSIRSHGMSVRIRDANFDEQPWNENDHWNGS
jgi:hypothetical protein